MKHIKLLIILLLISQKIILAQTGTVRGFVYDKSNGEPIIFTNVYLKGTTYGVATDVNGYYSISKVKEGKYFLTVSYVGYDLLSIPIRYLFFLGGVVHFLGLKARTRRAVFNPPHETHVAFQLMSE